MDRGVANFWRMVALSVPLIGLLGGLGYLILGLLGWPGWAFGLAGTAAALGTVWAGSKWVIIPEPAPLVKMRPAAPPYDPRHPLTCVHLRPVEQAMAAAGVPIVVRWAEKGRIYAGCAFEAGRYPLPVEVKLVEMSDPREGDSALLHCLQCGSWIDTDVYSKLRFPGGLSG